MSFPQSGEVWKEYREIKRKADGLGKEALELSRPWDEVRDDGRPRRPVPSRGEEATVAAILSVGARIEALTYVLQRLAPGEEGGRE